jgi:hypothetical protein
LNILYHSCNGFSRVVIQYNNNNSKNNMIVCYIIIIQALQGYHHEHNIHLHLYNTYLVYSFDHGTYKTFRSYRSSRYRKRFCVFKRACCQFLSRLSLYNNIKKKKMNHMVFPGDHRLSEFLEIYTPPRHIVHNIMA